MRSATLTPIATTGSVDPAAASPSGLFRPVIPRPSGPLALALRSRNQQHLKLVTVACSGNTRQTSPACAPRIPLIQLGDAVQAVERRHLVALCERRVVEDRVNEVFQPATERHHRLPDVQQFARALTDDMHAENRVVLAVEDELESSCRVTANLPARNLSVVGHAHLVGHILFGKLLLGLADET